ncbi:MAG: type II toxin-antitoxin system PemK/MazF family toxin [Pseudomonadales bacterium]|nr:type II toxin-antitoxin system PemK/MazF family toxin [Pseudomonadales bacterium]
MSRSYVPERNDIIWLDFDPTKGREIGKIRPALVLSSKEYNRRTGLLICCPITTSIRGGATEVKVDNLESPSVVAASLIQTLSWKDWQTEFIVNAEEGVLDEVLMRLIPLIGADKLIEDIVNRNA